MSKKAKGNARARTNVIRPLDPQVGFDELLENDIVEDIALDMVQLIVDKGAAILYGHFIQDKAEEVTASETINNIVNTVEFQLMPHDQGELLAPEEAASQRKQIPWDDDDDTDTEPEPDDLEEYVQLWTAEPEPRPCDIDLWASGVVPMKQQKVMTPLHRAKYAGDDNGVNPGDTGSEGTRSMHSISSQRSRYSGSARSVRSAMSSRSTRSGRSSIGSRYTSHTNRSGRSRMSVTSRSLFGSTLGGRRGGGMGRIGEGPFSISVPKTPHEMETDRLRASELSKMERKRKQREKKMKLKEAGEEEIKRYEKLKAELAGKSYAFDEEGEVILVQPPKSMPAFGHHPKINVADTLEGLEDLSRPKPRGKPAGKRARVARRKTQDTGFISLDTQPSLADKMELSQGVSLRIGSNVKSGRSDAPPEDPAQMTFKQYNRMLAGDRLDTANTEAFGRARNVVTPTANVPPVRVGEVQQAETAPPDRAAAAAAARALLEEEEKDADILLLPPGSARSLEAEDTEANGTGGEEQKDQASRLVEEVDEKDFNFLLMKDPSWGRNPQEPPDPVRALPGKESRRPVGSLSPKRGGPRMRQYMEARRDPSLPSSPIKARLRLPPPVFPATVGHGFIRPGEEPASRDISLSYQQQLSLGGSLPRNRDLPGLESSTGLAPIGRPSPRKTGFFAKRETRGKVETTDKARAYFG